jgi:hypothetical protein
MQPEISVIAIIVVRPNILTNATGATLGGVESIPVPYEPDFATL